MLRFAQRICEVAGLLCLIVAAVAYLDSGLVARQALGHFDSALASATELQVPNPDQSSWSQRAKRAFAELAEPAPSPMAVLTIERLGLRAPVFAGTDRLTLNRGIGLVEGTASPGEHGNIALSAHRDSFFRPLKDIREGDVIELQTLEGKQRFIVEYTFITDPFDIGVLDPTPTDVLTLITCYPFYYVGFAPDRFIVRAVPIDS